MPGRAEQNNKHGNQGHWQPSPVSSKDCFQCPPSVKHTICTEVDVTDFDRFKGREKLVTMGVVRQVLKMWAEVDATGSDGEIC